MADGEKVHVKAVVHVKVTVALHNEDELTSDMSLDAIRKKAGEMVTERMQKALGSADSYLKLSRATAEFIRTEDVQF